MKDWKEALGSLLDSGDLPSGEDLAPESGVSGEANKSTGNGRKGRGSVNVVYEKKGRGGKPATILEGFEGDDDEVSALAGRLKKSLGIGGSSRGGEILLQGDQRHARLKELLEKEGFRVKGIK